MGASVVEGACGHTITDFDRLGIAQWNHVGALLEPLSIWPANMGSIGEGHC